MAQGSRSRPLELFLTGALPFRLHPAPQPSEQLVLGRLTLLPLRRFLPDACTSALAGTAALWSSQREIHLLLPYSAQGLSTQCLQSYLWPLPTMLEMIGAPVRSLRGRSAATRERRVPASPALLPL